jgi:YHS domain-containing protein
MTLSLHRLIGRFALVAVIPAIALAACSDRSHDHHQQHSDAATHSHSQDVATATPDASGVSFIYLLATDPVTGEALGASPVIVQHEDREFRFASQANADTFQEQPNDYITAVDRHVVQSQLPHYPLDTCVVAGGKLGSMGEPVNDVYRNRLVRYCCAGCRGQFRAEPAKYLAVIDQAVIEQQQADYPLTTCVVSGEGLADHGEPIDRVYGTQLVRMCCQGCVSDFERDPARYLALLQRGEAAGTAHGGHDHSSHGHGGHAH